METVVLASVRLGEPASPAIVLAGLADGSATLTAEGDLVFTSGGDVYRVELPT